MEHTVGDKVKLKIAYETKLGYRVVINGKDDGLLFNSEIFQDLREGLELPGYIKNIREDGKIDVSLKPQGFKNLIHTDVDKVLKKLQGNNGELLLSDKSSPDDIYAKLKMSKKAFKRAIGNLYKQKRIIISNDRIKLIN